MQIIVTFVQSEWQRGDLFKLRPIQTEYVADYISPLSSLQIIIIITIKLCCQVLCRVAILIARLILILNKLGIGVIWKTLASFDAIVTLGGKITAITLSSNIPISDEMRRNLILLPVSGSWPHSGWPLWSLGISASEARPWGCNLLWEGMRRVITHYRYTETGYTGNTSLLPLSHDV